MAKEAIKKFSGQIIGYIDTSNSSKYVATDFAGRILGFYYPSRGVTTDFSGQILYYGNMLGALIYRANN